jgi:inhibitor of cysteine peptidase
MKKVFSLMCLLAFTVFTSAASLPSTTENGSSIGLSLNGQPVVFSSMPLLIDNTLMVPLRDLSESLGVRVDWDGSSQTAAAVKGDQSIKLTIDNVQALRGDQIHKLDAAPRMQDGKLFVPLRFFSESFDFNVYWDGMNKSVAIVDADKSLPTLGSLDHMQELFKDSGNVVAVGGGSGGSFIAESSVAIKAPVSASPSAAAEKSASTDASASAPQSQTNPAYSKTNVQVDGVDEADIIKTDGKYIYQVNRNRVIIASAYPADQMKVTQTLAFEDKNFNARELYIDESYMVVIGTTYYPRADVSVPRADVADPAATSTASPAVQPMITTKENYNVKLLPFRTDRSTTKAIVYELGDRTQVKKIREVDIEGNYISSRKVGSSLYLIANKSFNVNMLFYDKATPAMKEAAIENSIPTYRDSAAGDAFVNIGYEDIRYFPKSIQSNYLMVAGLNLSQPEQKLNVTSYLGQGNQVYASQNNLYVTTNEYTLVDPQPASGSAPAIKRVNMGEANSVIYKFGLSEGKIQYKGRGKVPGRTINQFAMDEMDGNFRIATTVGFAGNSNQNSSKNNIYVLNESMNTVGKIEDIAPGEQIYSVRYAGNRAYMVTFRTVDPLFVIDLKDPQAPKILGKLKIPGYSNYLHPYDDNHLIGFGKDAIEVSNNNGINGGAQTSAYYQGMKMAMFDVTDVTNPKEMFTESIGGRGTDSELLRNHKALLFSKENNLLAFPVTVMETNGTTAQNPSGTAMNNVTRYGDFSFQGAYVYKFDLTNGFKLQGKITHLTDDDYMKAGQTANNGARNIQRILYIGDALYTSSTQMLKVTDSTTMKDLNSITLP